MKIFIDCRVDERIVRRLKRNMIIRNLSVYEISDVYLNFVRYRHASYVEPSKFKTDMIINETLK